ncbi:MULTISPECIES: sugar ABC transporter permease [Actinomycetes]|uniref:Sugar ABC transporter permease n=2 Tax=Actinomycetes TaxID=1760 RepID=A0ABP6M306_9MICC
MTTTAPVTPPAGPADAAASSAKPSPAPRSRSRSERWVILLLLAPTVVGMGIFTLLPIAGSLALAFFRWDLLSAPEFAGVDNFLTLGADPTVRTAFLNTIVFVIVAVTLQLSLAMFLAVMVQSRMPEWLRLFFRSTFFFPLVLSAAGVSIFMSYLFNEQFGVVNWLLGLVGIPNVPWLTTPTGAAAVVIFVFVWQNFGFSFLILLGGIASIPKELYEAAELDGARGWGAFRNVTFPLVSPSLLVASVTAMIMALQVFDQPYVLTRGGPGDSTRSAVMVVFEAAFQRLEFGLASAAGLVLMLIIMLITWAQFRLSRRFVFYQ